MHSQHASKRVLSQSNFQHPSNIRLMSIATDIQIAAFNQYVLLSVSIGLSTLALMRIELALNLVHKRTHIMPGAHDRENLLCLSCAPDNAHSIRFKLNHSQRRFECTFSQIRMCVNSLQI